MSLDPEIDAGHPGPDRRLRRAVHVRHAVPGPDRRGAVGYIDGKYVLNPTASQLKDSQLDLVVAGTESAVLMVESEAKQLPEDVMLGAVTFGHQQMQRGDPGHPRAGRRGRHTPWDWQAPVGRHRADGRRRRRRRQGPP
jgi:polyribonucleotide nucleotidyltransferase